MNIRCGVPQGSVIGPLLFILFVNDITNIAPCYLFADDCIVEQTGETPQSAVDKTNKLLPDITKWYSTNLLKMNSDKPTVLLLSNKSIDSSQFQPVNINSFNVPFSKSLKYLGVYLEPSLTWNYHIATTKRKVMPLVINFSRIRNLIDQCTAKLFYTSLIRPILEYASPVLFSMSVTNSSILETIQNKCIQIILQENPRVSSHYIREQTNIPSLANRRKFLFLCEFYQLFNNLSPSLSSMYFENAPMTNYTLRSSSSSKLYIPGMNKSIGQRSLQYLGPHTFNTLPDHIRLSESLSTFKNKLRDYLLKP
jgi:hypothetical protein